MEGLKPLSKTMIVLLGQPEDPRIPPSSMARVQIGEAFPKDIQAILVDLDATDGEPATVSLRRIKVMDGLEWATDEEYAISSMSLIIEYEDAHVVS
jgi:hypothetical protein